jgi:hypothetical protein
MDVHHHFGPHCTRPKPSQACSYAIMLENIYDLFGPQCRGATISNHIAEEASFRTASQKRHHFEAHCTSEFMLTNVYNQFKPHCTGGLQADDHLASIQTSDGAHSAVARLPRPTALRVADVIFLPSFCPMNRLTQKGRATIASSNRCCSLLSTLA